MAERAAAPGAVAVPVAVPVVTSEAVTAPAKFEPLPPPPMPEPMPEPPSVEAAPVDEPPRRKSMTELPPMDDLDSGWDLGDSDPTATTETSTPSSSEMAGDSATGGDGIDEPGWD